MKPFNWRDHLKVHPAAELFPPLSEPELKELADDILKNGLRTKIVLWSPVDPRDKEEGLLDGVSRLNALALLGLLCVDDYGHLCTTKRWIRDRGWSDDGPDQIQHQTVSGDPYALVISFNLRRRHLNHEQRADALAKIIARSPEKSDRRIAKELGVDHKTIGHARAKGEQLGRIPQLKKTVGADGKARGKPKTKAAPKATKSVSPKDAALFAFTDRVLDLLQRISKHDPARFVGTAVKPEDLTKLSKFFAELAQLKSAKGEPPPEVLRYTDLCEAEGTKVARS